MPFDENCFDFALTVTTICFIRNPIAVLNEVMRILKPEGNFIIGFIDRETRLGKIYESVKSSNKFYRDARFYSAGEVIRLLQLSEFIPDRPCQTIFSNPDTMTAPDPISDGYSDGAFVVVNSDKSS